MSTLLAIGFVSLLGRSCILWITKSHDARHNADHCTSPPNPPWAVAHDGNESTMSFWSAGACA